MNSISPTTAFLSLGSNVGDRVGNLRAAIGELCGEGITLLRASSIYETEPVDNTNQDWFLNCVAEVSTTLEPLALLHKLQQVEKKLGRERIVPKGPRTLDIDILLYGDLVLASEKLTLPHPRMLARRFVLEPLCEIAPTLRLPIAGNTVEQALRDLSDSSQVRIVTKALCA